MIDIVVIGDADGGHNAGDIACLEDPEIPFVEVVVVAVEVGAAILGGGLSFVDLVAESEEDVWVLFQDVAEGEGIGLPEFDGGPVEAVVLNAAIGDALAGGGGEGDLRLVDGVFANGAGPLIGGVVDFYGDAKVGVAGVIPSGNFESGGVGGERVGLVDGGACDLVPGVTVPGFERDRRGGSEVERGELCGEFERLAAEGVHRSEDGEMAIRFRVEGGSGA